MGQFFICEPWIGEKNFSVLNLHHKKEMMDRPTIETINQQVDELKDVVKDNIDKVLDRGDKLVDLQGRAEDLEQNVSETISNTYTFDRFLTVAFLDNDVFCSH